MPVWTSLPDDLNVNPAGRHARMSRMSRQQIQRLQQIHRMLSRGRQVSRDDLLAAFDPPVSWRTIKRDLETLRKSWGAPIRWEPGNDGGYRYAPTAGEPHFELPGFWLGPDEIWALTACLRILEDMQPGTLGNLTEPVRRRLANLLQNSGHDPERVMACFDTRITGARLVDATTFRRIAQAVLDNQQVDLRYHARYTDDETTRRVDPHRLVFHRGTWYLLAWDNDYRGPRIFSLDRILEIHKTDLRTRTRADQVTGLIDHGFGIFIGDEIREAVLRFAPESVAWLADEIWHRDQQDERQADGSLIRRLPYANATELTMEILRHGPAVEVLEPADLRATVAERLRSAAARYD